MFAAVRVIASCASTYCLFATSALATGLERPVMDEIAVSDELTAIWLPLMDILAPAAMFLAAEYCEYKIGDVPKTVGGGDVWTNSYPP